MICGVTGASGFTGSRLLARLSQENQTVRALVRKTSNTSGLTASGPQLVYGDIADPEAVNRFVSGCEVVYHVAALYRETVVPDSEYHRVNVTGTENVVRSCLKHRVKKLVHCSTIGVLGHITYPPADETTPYAPGDPYQQSKCEGERLVLRYIRDEGLPAVIVRPAAIYGPGDTRLLKLFRMIASNRFVMVGSGKVFYHLVFIDNLVNGFRLAADSDQSIGQTYIIADEKYVPLWELVYTIADELDVKRPWMRVPKLPVQWLGSMVQAVCVPLGITPPIHRRRVDFFTKSRAFRIDKAKIELGYQPDVDLQSGIRETILWYRENGLL